MLGAVCCCLSLWFHGHERILDALPLVAVVVMLNTATILQQNGVFRSPHCLLGRLFNPLAHWAVVLLFIVNAFARVPLKSRLRAC